MSTIYTTNGRPIAGRVGPSGPDGPSGPMGPTGASGTPGINGVSGPSGPSGRSGPTGPSGNIGAAGVFTVPSVVINPSGTQRIFAAGNQLSYSDNNGNTWQNYTSGATTYSNVISCACNSSNVLLIGGTSVFKTVIGSDTVSNVTFGGNPNPIVLDAAPSCTRILWLPYYSKFLIVLTYSVPGLGSFSGSTTFRIWSLPSSDTNASLIYSAPDPQISVDNPRPTSLNVVDITINGSFLNVSVFDFNAIQSSSLYSSDGGTIWNSTAYDPYTCYMSVVPYYQNSWLRLSAGPVTLLGSTFTPNAITSIEAYPIGVNGAVSLPVGPAYDPALYPFAPGASYQISSPIDAGYILGAAFNGQTWSVILPATWNPDHTINTRGVLTIFTSYDLATATSGDINKITFIDETNASRTQQISCPVTTDWRDNLRKPRIVWTGQRFIAFGNSPNSDTNAGILTSQYGTNWSSVPTANAPNTRNISEICFTPVSVILTKGVDEYTRYMISANTTFTGDMCAGSTIYVKNIGTSPVEATVGAKTILLNANLTPYGGASTDAVITKNPGESMTIN